MSETAVASNERWWAEQELQAVLQAELQAELAAALKGVHTLPGLMKAIEAEKVRLDSLELVVQRLWSPLREVLVHCVGLEGHERKSLDQVRELLGPSMPVNQATLPRAISVVQIFLKSCNAAYNPFVTSPPPQDVSLATLMVEATLFGYRDGLSRSVCYNLEAVIEATLCKRMNKREAGWFRPGEGGSGEFTRGERTMDNLTLNDLCSHTITQLRVTQVQAQLLNKALEVFGRSMAPRATTTRRLRWI